jgi:hypothetical protein
VPRAAGGQPPVRLGKRALRTACQLDKARRASESVILSPGPPWGRNCG